MKRYVIGLVITLAATILFLWVIFGCGRHGRQVKQDEQQGKEAAIALLKKLPQFQQFEWNLIRYAVHDPDMNAFAQPDEEKWAASDMGEICNELSLSRDKTFSAEWAAELSGSDKRWCAVWTWDDPRTISPVREYSELSKAVHVARVKGSLLFGNERSVKEVASAIGGTKPRQTMWDDPIISEIWEALPPGFSMVVGTGTEHTFVYEMGERVQGWGQSTTKLDAESARVTFAALCASSEITEDVLGDMSALLTDLSIKPDSEETRGSLVIVSFKQPLSRIPF